MVDKVSNPEDEYFAREDIEKRYRLAKEQAAKQKVEEAEALKQAHFMKCPKCGNDLQAIMFRGIELDRCFTCSGTWLDAGELEKLAGEEEKHGVIDAVVRVFRRS
jgi:uncharacterized protein